MTNLINIILILLIISFFLFLQLLLIFVLLYRRQDFGKAKNKSILFILSILDELLKSKNREDLEELHNKLNRKKENFFKDLLLDYKKLSKKDKKILKDELDMIFKKIDDTFHEKLEDYSTNTVLDKIESLFDKISETISKKAINDSSMNISSELKDKINDHINSEYNDKNAELELNKKFEKFNKLNEQTSSTIEEFKEVPKIPKSFFNQSLKDDELAAQIRNLSLEHTELQILLQRIYKEAGANKLSLLLTTHVDFSFIEIHKVGFGDKEIKRIILNKKNILIKHLYLKKRITYIKNYKKYGKLFTENKTIKELKDMNSLLIFPIKYYGDIRALILLFFNEDKNNNLDFLISIFKKYSRLLKKNILKLL